MKRSAAREVAVRLCYSAEIAGMENAARQLAVCGYEKSVMLESSQRVSEKYKDYTPEQFYRCAGEAARKFADMVESYKADK